MPSNAIITCSFCSVSFAETDIQEGTNIVFSISLL